MVYENRRQKTIFNTLNTSRNIAIPKNLFEAIFPILIL